MSLTSIEISSAIQICSMCDDDTLNSRFGSFILVSLSDFLTQLKVLAFSVLLNDEALLKVNAWPLLKMK